MVYRNTRLHEARDFSNIYKRGKVLLSKNLQIRYLQNSINHSRFAIIVSNKVTKKATKRNRIRRQIRSIILPILEKFSGNFDMLFIVKSSALGKKYEELHKEISHIFFGGDNKNA